MSSEFLLSTVQIAEKNEDYYGASLKPLLAYLSFTVFLGLLRVISTRSSHLQNTPALINQPPQGVCETSGNAFKGAPFLISSSVVLVLPGPTHQSPKSLIVSFVMKNGWNSLLNLLQFLGNQECLITVLVVFLDQLKPLQNRSFRFFAHLNLHPDFAELIKTTWNSLSFHGSKQLCVSKKLKHLKPLIRSFHKENYSDLEKRVQEAFDQLTRCQHLSLTSPSSTTYEAEREAHSKWFELARAEDKFLRQRSRIQWTVDGDANTTFYHRVIRVRQNQSHVHFLIDDDDTVIDTLDGVKQHAVAYFQRLLGGSNAPTTSTPEDIASLMQVKCSQDAITALSAPFTDMDIQDAFMSLPRNKSSGPDGYPAEFFIGNWKAVGRDMIGAVREFLNTGELLQQ